MENEKRILEEAFDKLQLHTGIKANWVYKPQNGIDGDADIFIEGKKYHVDLEIKREVRQYQLTQLLEKARQHSAFMIVAEHIFPAVKEQLRKEKIAYLDIAGNIFIHAKTTYVWVDGNRSPTRSKPVTNRAFTKTGLKVVFYLLQQPEAINMPYRHLAENTKVALGNIQNVLDGLKEAGFMLQRNEQQKILHDRKRLLNRWIDGYRETLRPSLHIGNYRFWGRTATTDWQTLVIPENAIALWGGEPAGAAITEYLNPQVLTLYTDNKSALVPKWRLVPDDNGELHVYRLFWNPNPHHQFAPPLLVYADLIITDDARCIETAQMIYEEHLKELFENDR